MKTTPHSNIDIANDVKHIPNNNFSEIQCTMYGDLCVQSFSAFFMWEKVLNANPFKRFLEIGAGFGGTSLYFLLWAEQLRAQYHGYEKMKSRGKAHQRSVLKKLHDLVGHIHYGDVFTAQAILDIGDLIRQPGRTIIFCDGGDKVHEFRVFAPSMKSGDIIAAHDWPRAIQYEWVAETIEEVGLEQMLPHECEELQTHTTWWEKP